uniref:Zinc finger protein 2 homolog n=1 Tax=Labrus bergylta TaxID=56723 RepID=A0A3Q3KX01_9LABR
MTGVTEEADDDQQFPSEGEETLPVIQTSARLSLKKCRPTHPCSVCGRVFSRPSRLADHLASHAGEKRHSCSVCGKRFAKKINLTSHLRVHTGEKPYSCPHCGVSYAQMSCLRRHLPRHAAEKPHVCMFCSRGFVQRRHLVQHERTHTGEKPFACPLCPKRFASNAGFSEHQKSHTQRNLLCSLCGKAFSTPSSLRDHVRNHTGEKLHPCSLCSKSFNRPGLLKKHLQRHAVEQELAKARGSQNSEGTFYRCLKCHGDFPTPEKLQQHEELHRMALQFVCDACGRSFSRESRLREHARTHTGEKPFQCEVCEKQFSAQRALRRHREIHKKKGEGVAMTTENGSTQSEEDEEKADERVSEGSTAAGSAFDSCGLNGLREIKVEITSDVEDEEETMPSQSESVPDSPKKPYSCSICGKTFSRPSRLKEHFKNHATDSEQTLHRCSKCTETFSAVSDLRAHEKIHRKRHPCSICARSFLKPCHLRKHMRTHVRDGLIQEPADQEFWLNIKTEEVQQQQEVEVLQEEVQQQQEVEVLQEEVQQQQQQQEVHAAGLIQEVPEDLSTTNKTFITKPRLLPGNHGDQGSLSLKVVEVANEEGDVGGLINSDGEQEDPRPVLIGTSPSLIICCSFKNTDMTQTSKPPTPPTYRLIPRCGLSAPRFLLHPTARRPVPLGLSLERSLHTRVHKITREQHANNMVDLLFVWVQLEAC